MKIRRSGLHVYGADTQKPWTSADTQKPWTIYWFHLVGEDVAAFVKELGASYRRAVIDVGVEPQVFSVFEESLATMEVGYALPLRVAQLAVLANLSPSH